MKVKLGYVVSVLVICLFQRSAVSSESSENTTVNGTTSVENFTDTNSTVAPTTTQTSTTIPSSTSPTTLSSSTTTSTTTKSGSSPDSSSAGTSPTPSTNPTNRQFHAPSFIGGIVLSVGLMAISYVGFKFYKSRTERNYHTLRESLHM